MNTRLKMNMKLSRKQKKKNNRCEKCVFLRHIDNTSYLLLECTGLQEVNWKLHEILKVLAEHGPLQLPSRRF